MLVPIALIASMSCGGPESQSDSGPDISALQPGNYRTNPRTSEEVRTPENVDVQESLRLGQHVPLIMETNPRLVFNPVVYRTKVLTPLHPPRIQDQDFHVAVPGLVAGWETVGQRREESSLGRTIELAIMAFAEPKQATHAAEFLSDMALHGSSPPVGTIGIPGHPTAIGQVSEFGSLNVWVTQGNLMVETYIGAGVDIPPDTTGLAAEVKTVLDNLFSALGEYKPTPVDELGQLPVDRDGILAFALPGSEPVAEMVLDPSSLLNFLQRPDLAKRALEDSGVDLAVHGGARIYRTADPAAAERLKAYFVSQLNAAQQPVDSPPGMPAAHCTDDPESTSSLSCIFTSNRYVAIIDGSNQIQDLHQQVAAQYLLLAKVP
ncbi:DUF7373 family lipoprotein [Nocardia flavorosea]|uniref:Uncharacterized protein n=1 Tax=Nocardia flavorosea TaxID=53429 RepID=A0A846YB64_9NOCA|nr:hypothetical protein [Nocardia flavorosea]NKY56856.1 hypothetical protein [Nocardia flavorosea]